MKTPGHDRAFSFAKTEAFSYTLFTGRLTSQ
jgi:hypothetical protein